MRYLANKPGYGTRKKNNKKNKLKKNKKNKKENRICRQIQDLHSTFGIKERWSFANCTVYWYTLSTPRGWNWAFFPSTAAISKIQADFQNWHIWAWNLAIGKVSEVAHTLSFYLQGSKLSLFSLYGQRFPRYWQFFKTAIFGREAFPLAKVPEVAHILLSTPKGSK